MRQSSHGFALGNFGLIEIWLEIKGCDEEKQRKGCTPDPKLVEEYDCLKDQ